MATLTTNNQVLALPKPSISEQNSNWKVVSKRKPRKNRHFKVPRASQRGKEAERLSNGSRKGAQMKWEASAKHAKSSFRETGKLVHKNVFSGGTPPRTGWFPFGIILVSFLCFLWFFVACNLNLFEPGLVFETKARKKRGNSV